MIDIGTANIFRPRFGIIENIALGKNSAISKTIIDENKTVNNPTKKYKLFAASGKCNTLIKNITYFI